MIGFPKRAAGVVAVAVMTATSFAQTTANNNPEPALSIDFGRPNSAPAVVAQKPPSVESMPVLPITQKTVRDSVQSPPATFPSPPKSPAATELLAVSPDIIKVRHGITARVEVSDRDPSLISTPFRKPKIVDNDRIAQAKLMGGDIFVLPSRETTIFIKDGAQTNSAVIGLHLVPTRKEARSVTLIMDGAIPAERRDNTDWANKPNDYIDSLRITMKQVVMGEVPNGYTEGPLAAPMAVSGKIGAVPVRRYAGSETDIYEYQLTNNGSITVTLSEEAFASQTVRAVELYPNIAVAPGQSTNVYIMFSKESIE